jgi:hypothetical protein
MLRNYTLPLPSMRRAALAGAIALAAATAFAANVSPAAAFGHGGFRAHGGGFGGFHHGFHHRFFAFGGSGYFSSYPGDDYGADDGCLRRVWGAYGWRVINVCY